MRFAKNYVPNDQPFLVPIQTLQSITSRSSIIPGTGSAGNSMRYHSTGSDRIAVLYGTGDTYVHVGYVAYIGEMDHAGQWQTRRRVALAACPPALDGLNRASGRTYDPINYMRTPSYALKRNCS